jgi:hypothetical protein
MKTYNTTEPRDVDLFIEFAIGWEHTVEDDRVVITRDDDGNPVPHTYRIPNRVTAAQLMEAVKSIGQKRLNELASEGGVDAVVELVGAVVGRELVLGIAKDPTVETDAFMALVLDLAGQLGLHEALPDPT